MLLLVLIPSVTEGTEKWILSNTDINFQENNVVTHVKSLKNPQQILNL